jgi:nucleotide-binding universal stress UspA family protein
MSVTENNHAGPVLFCFDGSDGSRHALHAAADMLAPRAAVVLTVWETIATRLASNGLSTGFGVSYVPDEGALDEREESAAQEAADEGVRAGVERGWEATGRIERADIAVWRTIADVGDEIDASLIVCGARGLSAVKRAILGSVSEAVLHHCHRAVLIYP